MSMRKTIVRTITATTIHSVNVTFVDGKLTPIENNALVISGTIEEPKALKEVRKVYGDNAQVTKIEQVDDVYEISVSDFIKYATKVVAPTPEQVADGNKDVKPEPEKADDKKDTKPTK